MALCTYCGETATALDHVIPRIYAEMTYSINSDRGLLLKNFGKKVPACTECNSLLGAAPLLSVSARRAEVHRRLRVKYKNLLASPTWTDEEIEMLGPTLRSHVASCQEKRARIVARLHWRGDS